MTVGELLARISSRELTEWMAYAQVEPFGEERGDLRAGIVASTIANVNRDTKKRRKPFEPEEFMPKFNLTPAQESIELGRGEQEKSAQDVYAVFKTWAMVNRRK